MEINLIDGLIFKNLSSEHGDLSDCYRGQIKMLRDLSMLETIVKQLKPLEELKVDLEKQMPSGRSGYGE